MSAATSFYQAREITRGETYVSLHEEIQDYLLNKSFFKSENGVYNWFAPFITSRLPYYYRAIGNFTYLIGRINFNEYGQAELAIWIHCFVMQDEDGKPIRLNLNLNLDETKPDHIGIAAKMRIG